MDNIDTDAIYNLLDSLHDKVDALDFEMGRNRKLNTISIIISSFIGVVMIGMLSLIYYDNCNHRIDDITTVASFSDSARIHAMELQDIHSLLQQQALRQDILELNYKIDKKAKQAK